jgi:glycosyltransferase involved in cell wall biosynthesis
MKIVIPMLGLTPHGGNRILVAIANELAARSHPIEILIPRGRKTDLYTLHPNVKINEIGWRIKPKRLSYILFLFLVFFHLRDCFVIANYFLTVIPSYLACRIYKVKYIFFVQDIEYRFFSGFFQALFKRINEWTFRKGNIITANDYLYKEISPRWKIDFSINIGPNSIFFNHIKTSQEKAFDLIYFLRGERHKRLDRFDEFLDLASRHIKIVCISQDDEIITKYKPQISAVFKPKNDAELIDVFDRSRVLLLTSDHEGFSLPPLEGMARGLPPVIFECGGPSVYCVNLFNSILIKDGNVGTAFHAVKNLLEDFKLYETLSQNAQTTSQRFRLDLGINKLCNFLESKIISN